MIGTVPFDETVTSAMVRGLPVTVYRPESPASLLLARLWERVKQHLEESGTQSMELPTAALEGPELAQLSIAEASK